ncbi:hypothetical protein [Candidatus Tisiphia endosymbiont of Ceraclea dissimilis]|uniref:hypothetical protein n=1 Tax=Candidatus Tisiphia endosymbiont of Ceraclea dissimilis TaxID=3077928 RepID=UPI003CCB4DE4
MSIKLNFIFCIVSNYPSLCSTFKQPLVILLKWISKKIPLPVELLNLYFAYKFYPSQYNNKVFTN